MSADVVIWNCAGVPTQGSAYGDRLEQILVRNGLTVRQVPYMERHLTADELAAPCHLLSGGEVAVHDPDPFMQQALTDLTQVLVRAQAGDAMVIGTCLGMQMIAACLTHTDFVVERPGPINVGLAQFTGSDSVDPIDRHMVSAVFHYHRVSPDILQEPGINLRYTSDCAPVAAIDAGPNIIGYQFHPELSPADMRALARHNRELIEGFGITVDMVDDRIAELEAIWTENSADRLLAEPFRAFLSRPGLDRPKQAAVVKSVDFSEPKPSISVSSMTVIEEPENDKIHRQR